MGSRILHSLLLLGVFAVTVVTPSSGQGSKVVPPAASASPVRAGDCVTIGAMTGSRELEVITAVRNAFSRGDQYCVRGDDEACVARFCDSDAPFGILVTSNISALSNEEWSLAVKFPAGQPQPLKIVIGQARVLLVVDSISPIDAIELSQVRELLGSAARGKSWQQIIGKGPNTVMKCFGPDTKATGLAILRKVCMQYWTRLSGRVKQLHIDSIRDDLQACGDTKAVLKGVRSAVTSGLGVVEYPVDSNVAWDGVKPLSVKNSAGMVISPRLEALIQSEYPLAEIIVLYVHPKAIRQSEEFVRFCLSKEGAAICAKHDLVTPWRERQTITEGRMFDMKSGKGFHLSAVGIGEIGSATRELASEYVKAKAVIQLACSGCESDVSAIGAFVRLGAGATARSEKSATEASTSSPAATSSVSASALVPMPTITPFVKLGGKELLFLDGRPGGQAMDLHGEKWISLGPAETVPAGRAAAVVVCAGSKLDGLTSDQVKSIFSGEAGDWRALSSAAGVGARGGDALPPGRISRYGLHAQDLAANVFYKECLPAEKMTAVTVKKDSAEVISAIAGDPQGIGFIDLAALLTMVGGPATQPAEPMGGYSRGAKVPPGMAGILASEEAILAAAKMAGVKVLAIRVGTGASAKDVMPSAENIRTGMYPFAQRLFLYVHPKASDTAKDLAKFIATCGQSAADPPVAKEPNEPFWMNDAMRSVFAAETVKSVAEVYRKNGLIPLAVVQPARSLFPTSAPANSAPRSTTQSTRAEAIAPSAKPK